MSGTAQKVVLLGTFVARPLIAKWQVAIAEAEGFFSLFGLQMKVRVMLEVSEGGRPRYAAPKLASREGPAHDGMD